jgi:hypothetical protein
MEKDGGIVSEYRRLLRKTRKVETLLENPVSRSLERGADAKAKVMRVLGAEKTEAGSKVRGDFFLPICLSEDGAEVGVYLEGNKRPAITSHVVYPALELEEEPSLYAGAEDAVRHFLTGFAPYPEQYTSEGDPVGEEAA